MADQSPAMAAVGECTLTELPTSMCACIHHRGGQTPDEQAAAVVAANAGRAFAAARDGRCEGCEDPILRGQQITGAHGYGRGHYLHVGCNA